ncbi:FkbM family methyltransferase [Rhizobium sp.]
MAERRTKAGTGEEAGQVVARHFPDMPDAAAARVLFGDIAAARADLHAFRTDAPIALYGAGNLGRMASEFLQAVGRSYDFVVDRNAASLRNDPYWWAHKVIGLEEVPDAVKRSHVVLVTVATAAYAPVEQALRAAGFVHIAPFYDFAEGFRDVHPLSNGWFARPFSDLDLRMTQRALDGFSDDISRAHHLQFLAWRRLRQEWTFDGAPVTGGDRFFIPEVMATLGDDEIFIDAGAHHGSVIEAFSERMNGRFRRIVAVEPDAANRTQLKAFVETTMAGDGRITIFDCALGSEAGQARFHAGLGYASQIAPSGKETVRVEMLDALGPASFVKLHLEGGELAALKGARELFRRDRPVIAATVYHNDDGIWRTPLWLMETLVDYRFLFRLHSWCGTGAVVYAVPQERAR